MVLKYNIFDNVYLLNGDGLDELQGRSVQVVHGEARQYTPYRPGLISTNKGFRFELADTGIPKQSNTVLGINQVSNYHPSTLLGTIHSNDPSYAIGEIDVETKHTGLETKHKGIEPTRSELEKDSIYFGNHSSNRVSMPKHTNPIKSLAKKIAKTAEKFERRIEASHEKHYARFLDEEEFHYKTHFVKGHGMLSRPTVRRLHADGFEVKDGVVVKMGRKIKPSYY